MRKGVFQVQAPHFTAGGTWAEEVGGAWRCQSSAPIIKYMTGWSMWAVQAYCKRKNWTYEEVI